MNRNFLLLIVLLLVCCGSVTMNETMPRIKYNLQDPIYHRLKERIFSPTPASFDIAFIGSSHIWNAVDTELINQRRPGRYCYNFGVNWFGNDTKLVIVRDLLEHKPVRCVVLEITNFDDKEQHEYFKFLATLSDLSRTGKHAWSDLTVYDIFTLSTAMKRQTEHFASVALPFMIKGCYFAFREYVWKTPAVPQQEHDGFLPITTVYDFPDKSYTVSESDDSRYDIVLSPPVEEIGRLCRERQVPLYFLFVPARNEAYPGHKFIAELRRWGHPIILDSRQIYPPQFWYNSSHLNTAGAAVFTEMLLESELFKNSSPLVVK